MNLSSTLSKVKNLLEKDDIELEAATVGTYANQGDVIQGIIFKGDFDSLQPVYRIENYLELAGLFTRVKTVGDGVYILGDGRTVGYVGDWEGEIDIKKV
jgi:hypothetical protein